MVFFYVFLLSFFKFFIYLLDFFVLYLISEYKGEIIELKPIEGVSLDDIKFKVETNDIISFNKGVITALKKGEVTIEAENEYFKSILIK